MSACGGCSCHVNCKQTEIDFMGGRNALNRGRLGDGVNGGQEAGLMTSAEVLAGVGIGLVQTIEIGKQS